ncbi:ApeI family dehydratase [Gilvimarinus sp. F26214L]|uniref:ApeI family dehydratase n=1 Tax=Gilvimarinus sp. DZF01 TaxID=3461371 RepID=UPI004045EB05
MAEYVSLHKLLACERPSRPQAIRDGHELSWAAWRHRVSQWRALLSGHSGATWALYEPDTFEFSAALFALWACGKVACVPGSNQPLVVKNLDNRVAGYIGAFEPPEGKVLLSPPSEQAPALPDAVELDPDAAVMEIFTSGSSGEPQAIGKKLYQLAEEVDNLERLWGDLGEGATTVATVSHHHIYGLLFRVLWPLASGRRFDAQLSEYLESLNHLELPGADQPVLLISSPSHLSRIPADTDWSPLRTRCRAIFSSGAPLPREASISARQLLGRSPIEVYGSSETGGIATRQQAADHEVLWTPVPGLRVGVDEASGCLKILSPYLPPDQWYLTSDRVSIHPDGQFQLLGRADRIAKIEGKRVSLTEMEQRLGQHSFVEAARVLVLSGKRTEVAAVVVLTAEGADHLAREGRLALGRLFGDWLLEQFERPVLPRRWRYPGQLPMDSQGKVSQQQLSALFANTRQGRPLLPEVMETRHTEEGVRLELRIPPDLFYFQGHFPAAPILPGVVQLQWARHYGRELLGFSGKFSHLEAVKFQHVVRPGQHVSLELDYKRGRSKLSFRYFSDSGQHASGRIVNTTETAPS